jgi:broad specificity phosphatase PhoE
MRLILIRHGQTASNVAGSLDTAVPGPPLTELGQRQASALPAALADESVGAIFASTQQRAQLTAAPLADARGLKVRIRDGIREIDAGSLEMRTDRRSVERYLTICFDWARGRLDSRMPAAEAGHEVFARFDAVVGEASALDLDTVAFFSHGAIIRAWAGWAARNVDGDFVAQHPVGNTGVVILDGSVIDGWTVDSWTGAAVGGASLTDATADGPAADIAPA